jgi:endogenous inhibitor of DNA gyrase (YacG/DUF329 family)
VVKYGPWNHIKALKPFVGKRIADVSLASWVKKKYAFRIVGRLDEGSPAEGEDGYERNFMQKLLRRPKVLPHGKQEDTPCFLVRDSF